MSNYTHNFKDKINVKYEYTSRKRIDALTTDIRPHVVTLANDKKFTNAALSFLIMNEYNHDGKNEQDVLGRGNLLSDFPVLAQYINAKGDEHTKIARIAAYFKRNLKEYVRFLTSKYILRSYEEFKTMLGRAKAFYREAGDSVMLKKINFLSNDIQLQKKLMSTSRYNAKGVKRQKRMKRRRNSPMRVKAATFIINKAHEERYIDAMFDDMDDTYSVTESKPSEAEIEAREEAASRRIRTFQYISSNSRNGTSRRSLLRGLAGVDGSNISATIIKAYNLCRDVIMKELDKEEASIDRLWFRTYGTVRIRE